MRQVLFQIPLNSLWNRLPDLPVYGYGAMLFLAFVACTWLASRLAKREGVAPKHIQDLAIWIFVMGLIGARITFILVDKRTTFWDFFRIWDGGLVFYGSVFGGIVGFILGWFTILRHQGVSLWKMLDILAPCIAVGLAIGRVGCLLNGCCYGHVACAACPGISFPLSSPARTDMVRRGYQTAAGFTLEERDQQGIVGAVEPHSPAQQAGLKTGDHIVQINGKPADNNRAIHGAFLPGPRGKNDLAVRVERGNETKDLLFVPGTLPLHPTQIYETISAVLILLLLMSYLPLRHRDGMAMVMLMVAYAVHRYLNEMLRTDTDVVAFNMTFSQIVSIVLLAGAAVLALCVLLRPQGTSNRPATSHLLPLSESSPR